METVAVIVAVIVLALLWKPMFGDARGFWNCVKFWFKPNIISMFQGEGMEDLFAELKLIVWLAIGVASGFAVFHLLG